MSSKVFIIIINWNGWPDTEECLGSLAKVDYNNFEVILIDNGSKNNFQFPISNFQKLKIHTVYNKENLGFAGGNNQGIKMALQNGADYILLLNNDTTVESDFLTRMVEVMEKDETAGIAGPLIYFYDDRGKIWSAGGRITDYTTRGELIAYQKKDDGEYQVAEQVDYISGTCLLIKAEVIKKIGPISEDYFLYFEDVDWCQRAYRADWRCLLVPQAKIYHKGSKSTQEFSYPYIYYHTRNGLIFGARYGRPLIIYPLSIWIFLKQIIKFVLGRQRDWARPMMRGVWDFWNDKIGKIEGYY